MGLHLIPVLAKLTLVGAYHGAGSSSLVTALVLPFILKIPFIMGTHRVYSDVVEASRFFFFRLRVIMYGSDDHHPNNSTIATSSSSSRAGSGQRWLRALRLVRGRVTNVNTRFTSIAFSQEDSLHAASMLAL